MKEDWKVSRPEKHCAACRLPFAGGASFLSALFRDAAGALARRDYCVACWQSAGGGATPAAERIAYWRARPRPPEEKKRPARFVPQVAYAVFSQLYERPEKSDDDMRLVFILALSLMRHKMLRLRGIEREPGQSAGKSVLRLSGRKGDEFTVADPGLSEQDIAQLLGRVGEVLEMDLDAEGSRLKIEG